MASGAASIKRYRTGERIPASGIYRVYHLAHRVPHEVTLIEGEKFPRCQKCEEAVAFEPLRISPDHETKSVIVLYQLPEIDPDDAA